MNVWEMPFLVAKALIPSKQLVVADGGVGSQASLGARVEDLGSCVSW